MSKVIEEIARLIDPDAWHEKLPEDGLAMWWIDRRHKARAKAQAAYSVMEKRFGEMRAALIDVQQYPLPMRTERLIAEALNNESKPVENGHG